MKKIDCLKNFMVNRKYYILDETEEQVKIDAINDANMCLDMIIEKYSDNDDNNYIILYTNYDNYIMNYVIEYDSEEGLWYLKIIKVDIA